MKKCETDDTKQLELPLTGESNPINTPPRADPELAAYRMWLGAPAVFRCIVPHFPNCGWPVLCFFAEGRRRAVELAIANPGLAGMLAREFFPPGWEAAPEGARHLCRSLGQKQRELLAFLDLPGEPWLVRVLSKLTREFGQPDVLPHLRKLVQDPDAARVLPHLPLINRSMFEVMQPENLPFLSYRFLMELRHTDQMELSPGMIQSLLRDASAHAEKGGSVPVFKSIRHLERWHWDTLGSEGLHSVAFPKPPFDGSKWIRPITHSHMLKRESKEMRHCVVTYEEEILRGDVAIYVLLHPQRATLGLQKNRDGSWRIFDFRLPFNRRPSSESRRTVEAWLSKAQAG